MPPTTPIAAIPWTDPYELGLSAFGVALEAGYVAGALSGLSKWIGDIRGVGISTINDARIRGAVSQHCYVGVNLGSSDSRITDSDLWDHRDACLWIARDAGNCSSVGNHFYGSRVAIYNEAGEGYQSTADKVEDSLIGALCNAESDFIGTRFKQNMVRDVVIRGGDSGLYGCKVKVQLETKEHNVFAVDGLPSYSGKAGIQLDGGGAIIDGGLVNLVNWIHPANTPSGNPAKCIIVNAPDCIIRTKLIKSDGLNGSIGIYVTQKATNLRVDCDAIGFNAPLDKMIVVEPGVIGLDATFRNYAKSGRTSNRITINGRAA